MQAIEVEGAKMSNEAESAYKLGMKEFGSGNVHEALQLWYHASELGNPETMC
jgi:hypothetical protein